MKTKKIALALAFVAAGVLGVVVYFLMPGSAVSPGDGDMVQQSDLTEITLTNDPSIRDEFLPYLGKINPGTEQLYTEEEVRKIQTLKDQYPASAAVDDLIDPDSAEALERRRRQMEIGTKIRDGIASEAEVRDYFDSAERKVTELIEIHKGGGGIRTNPGKLANLERNLKSLHMVRDLQLKKLEDAE